MLFNLTLRRTGQTETFKVLRRFDDAQHALQYFLNHSKTLDPEPLPDIVILDLKLPGWSGFDFLERLKPLHPRPVIGVFTNSALPQDRERATKLGADLFETKTVEPAAFARFLHYLARIADASPANAL